jgi:DNA-binding NarL/FixJ family response regulator
MADPGEAVQEVRGAVAVPDHAANGHVTEGTVAKSDAAKNDPDALVAQIEHTREDLARTIDALADRVSPASNVRILRTKVMEQLGRREVQMGAAAAGAVVVGLAVLRVWGRRRHR